MSKVIGLIGLGVMGENIARNFIDHGTEVHAFNSSEKKLNQIKNTVDKSLFYGYTSIEEMVDSIEEPRLILLMVPAGDATKEVINTLSKKLSKGDWIIDGGNSNYRDSEENGAQLEKKKINFAGLGVSGGEKGARYGPALMLGVKNIDMIKSIQKCLDEIAAIDSEKNKCFKTYSGYGAGHFVKMVHNGIEYAEMQLISEIYDLLRKNDKGRDDIEDIFNKLAESEQGSYLFEITKKIISKKENKGYLLDRISSVANHKGTGKWTIEAGMKLEVPVPSIAAAFDSRVISHNTLHLVSSSSNKNEATEISYEKIYEAIYQLRISIFLQGLSLIKKGSVEYGWEISIEDVLYNWKSGCIIRTKLLNSLPSLINIFDNKSNDEIDKLLEITPISSELINLANKKSVPTPCMSASLNWLLSIFSNSLPTNLIQAQRDYFGSHMVELIDSPDDGPVHIEWE